jgi:hypothetical protein
MPMFTLTLPQPSVYLNGGEVSAQFLKCRDSSHLRMIRTRGRKGDVGRKYQFSCQYCQKTVMRYLKMWRDCVKKRYPKFEYTLAKEAQLTGAIHLHLIINDGFTGFHRTDYEYLKRTWCRITGAGRSGQNVKESPYFKEVMKSLPHLPLEEKTAALLELRSTPEFLKSVEQTVRYQSKYIQKSFEAKIPKYVRRSTRIHNWGLGVSYAPESRRIRSDLLAGRGLEECKRPSLSRPAG